MNYHRATGTALLLCPLLFCLTAQAKEYTLVVQPVQTADVTRQTYAPLADYLSESLGETVTLVTAQNFFSYWAVMKQGDKYDFILDAAHLTDFRVQKMHYTPLAKLPDVVSLSLVTGPDTLVFEANDLVGKRIATLGAPSLAAIRLSQIFPNPVRQPVIVEVNNSQVAIQKLRSKEVDAAILPTPLVGAQADFNTVMTTEQIPHMALSASPRVPPSVQAQVQQALLTALNKPKGRKALKSMGVKTFSETSAARYAGYGKLLEGTWGY